MGAGVASLSTAQKKQAGGGGSGPPFALNSADNGLSVDPVSRHIVLGNDTGGITATLLKDRVIPMAGFNVGFSDASGDIFLIRDDTGPMLFSFWSAGPIAVLNDSFGNRFLQVDQITGEYALGDADNAAGGIFLQMIDNPVGPNVDAVFQKGAVNRYFVIDLANGLYQFGDITGSANGANLAIDDVQPSFIFRDTARQYIVADANQDIYQLGNATSGNDIRINGVSGLTEINTIGGTGLRLDQGNGMYQIGDISVGANGSKIVIDDAAQTITNNKRTFVTGGIVVDANAFNIVIRDLSGVFNAGTIQRDGVTGGLDISALTAGIGLNPTGGADTTFVRGNAIVLGTANNTFKWAANIAAPGLTATPVFTSYYGGNTNALGDPAEWVLIDVNGTLRKIPAYAV